MGLPPAPLPGPVNQNPADGATVTEQFYAQVQVSAEPRLSLSQHGPLRIVEAVDDRGQSLLPAGCQLVTPRYLAATSG